MEETYEISLDEKILFEILLKKEMYKTKDYINEYSRDIYKNDEIAQEVLKNNIDNLKKYEYLINRLDNL